MGTLGRVQEMALSESACQQATAMISVARAAFEKWRVVAPAERTRRVGVLRRQIAERRNEIADAICSDTKKTRAEAFLSDIFPTLELLAYIEKHAARILRHRKRPTPIFFPASKSYVDYRPLGVALVIAPWNNPLQLSIVPAASALAAGNVVVLKVSERTPAVAEVAASLFTEADFADAVRVNAGGAETAKALVDARPDIIFFTGGTENGRSVYAAAARQMIPAILELGGKDPMIVFADADMSRAVHAAIFGAFSHAGQHCISTKRLYVQRAAYEKFVEQLAAEARALTHCGNQNDERGLKAAVGQVREALKMGARLLAPSAEDGIGVVPTVVTDCSHSMRVMREETFAPVLAVMPFDTPDEAVGLANDSPFGLNASVWSCDEPLAREVVARLDAGNAYINNVFINAGNPHLPFGGVKLSGMGRYHGPEGILAFCEPVSVMVSRSKQEYEPAWFPHDDSKCETIEQLIEARHGRLGFWRRVLLWRKLYRKLMAGNR